MTPPDTSSPVLSVVIPAPGDVMLIERIVASLAEQSLAPRMELVVVAEHPGQRLPPSLTARFGWAQVVGRTQWTTMTDARVEGVLRARAPIVALCEDHCFPAPGWAEALVAAHLGPWAAVGPAFLNANPATRVSWANLAIEYGPWLHPVAAGPCAHVPGHNSSYKRSILLEYGPRLAAMLEAESVLHWDLRQRGMAVAMEPAARSRHLNFSRFGASIALRFSCGRLFAASRASGWPLWRRALFACGSAALPAVRTARALRDLGRVGDTRPRRGLSVVIFTLLCFDALGEAVGYAIGAGDQSRRMSAIETDRGRFLSARDRAVMRG